MPYVVRELEDDERVERSVFTTVEQIAALPDRVRAIKAWATEALVRGLVENTLRTGLSCLELVEYATNEPVH